MREVHRLNFPFIPHLLKEATLKTSTVMLLLSSLCTTFALAQNCGNRPTAGGTTSVCYGYAISRAFGYTGSTAVNYRPMTTWVSSEHFKWNPGTNFQEGDIVQWGPATANSEIGLSAANAHAAFVVQINGVANTPDGAREMGFAGTVRDEDPVSQWSNVILAEVYGEGGGETSSITMSASNIREEARSYVYKGFWRLRDEYKCALTFSNSFGSGVIYVGKDDEGKYLNHESGYTERATYNATIPAKAELSHSVGATKWTFDNRWWKNGQNNFTTQAISIVVDQYNAEWSARYTSGGSPSSLVYFENQSDNLPINSIIRVNDEDKISKTPGYTPGAVSATAYQTLLVDRVHYTFSQWSTGSTNLSISPTSAGTYIAHYTFDYVLPPADLNTYSTAVGSAFHLKWRKVSNAYQYVDTIEVWRKVKDVHAAMIIARRSPTATEYTDHDYSLTSGYTDNLIDYDVRLRYKTPARTVTSSANWLTVFGTELAEPRRDEPEVLVSSSTPKEFTIAAFPNPFNPRTSVTYTIPEPSYVEVNLYDLSGRLVNNLVNSDKGPGSHTISWDATGQAGEKLASGVYILQIAVHPNNGSSAFNVSMKLLLAK